MKQFLQRSLSALLCLVMLLSCMPAISEMDPSATLQIAEAAATAAPEPENEAHLSANIQVLSLVEELPDEETPTDPPTEAPSAEPTEEPTQEPPAEPTEAPSGEPSADPSREPSEEPSEEPSAEPTADPSAEPSQEPTQEPAADPSQEPVQDFVIEEGVLTACNLMDAQLILPEGITAIAVSVFENRADLISVTLPESLTGIGERAFAGCTALEEVILPRQGFAIGREAFLGCIALTELILPYDVLIAENAFAGCEKLSLQVQRGSAADLYCAENNIPCTYPDPIPAAAIIPEKSSITIGVGEQVSIAGWKLEPAGASDTVTYSSKSKKIASVNAEGVVTGKKAGSSTTITIKTSGGAKCTVKVSVKKAPASIKLSAERTVIGVGEQLQIQSKLSNKSAGAVQYSLWSDGSALLDENGLLTAIAPGSASISASTYNDKHTKSPLAITILNAPESITLSENEITLGKGDTKVLSYTLNENSAGKVQFASSNPEIISVDESGKIKALADEGSAVITASTHVEGVSAQCTVTAVPAPTGLTLSAARKTIGVKEQLQLNVLFSPEGSSGSVKFKSSKASVASVDANGVVTAKKKGSATITATTHNGKKKTIKITVKKAPAAITPVAGRTVIGVGEQLQISCKLSAASAASVTYSISDESIASIDNSGLLTAILPGTVAVTAVTHNGKTGVLPITILNAPESITLAEKEILLGKGAARTIAYTLSENSAGKVQFASSNPEIISVDESGKIKALADEGSAVITASTHVEGVSAQCTVTAVPAPTALTLSAARKAMGVGEQMQLNVQFSPEGSSGSVKYKSSKASVASVDANGVVTAKKKGSATITATTHNGRKATLKITVKKAPTGITPVAGRTVIGMGEQLQISCKLSASSAANVTYSISDASIASIDNSGLLTAILPGKVTVTAEAHNKVSGSLEITILNAPESITLSESEIILGQGDSKILAYTLSEDSAGKVRFASDNPEIISVDASGRILALAAEGSAVITASTHVEGVSAQCTVTAAAAPTALTLNAVRQTIGVGEILKLESVLSPEGAQSTLKFTSGKKSVATVNANGEVTAIAPGSATITATTHNNKKKTITITVKKAPASVSLSAPRTQLGIGDTMQLNCKLSSGSAGSVTCMTQTPKLASVDENGVITALAAGTASFTATTHNGVTSEPFLVEIVAAPTSIQLDNASFLLGVGDKASLTGTVNEGSAGVILYASEDPSVAEVDPETGIITAIAPGKTRLTASTYVEGVTAGAEIEVRPAPTTLTLPFESLTLGKGDRIILKPRIDEGAQTTFTYKSSAAAYATVDANGQIVAVKSGEATITVKTHNGLVCKLALKVKKAPEDITAVPEEITLGVGETSVIAYKLSSGSASTVSYRSLNTEIVSVDESGMVTALALGQAEIKLTCHNGIVTTAKVNVVAAPKAAAMVTADVLGVGMECDSVVSLWPAEASSAVSFSTSDETIASIDANGHIKAISPGKAVLRASTYLENVYAERTITILPPPESVAFAQEEYTVSVDETLQLEPVINKGSCSAFTYSAKKSGFFTVNEDGLLTPIMRGTTTLTVTTHNGLTASTRITIVDPHYPEEISLKNAAPEYMESGEIFEPEVVVFPATAEPVIEWESSDSSVVSVHLQTGVITAVSYGRATITGESTRNPSLKISYSVVVLDSTRCLTMPNTRTDTSKIKTTLNQIKKVRASAYNELESLYVQGVITEADYKKRKTHIERAFDMHLFPWMTETKELYWSKANSEDGDKDFKPDMVYYGLPYTQTNRNYNVTRALDEGYYTSTSKGYYLLQGSKFANREYKGNDCSSYASMSLHGMDSSYSFMTTSSIASSGIYKTLSDWTALRPGDLLNKGGSHVVMFLYYANEAKTQMVIIEQGGSASADRAIDKKAYSNTIACSIKNVSYYTSRSYKIRRLKSLCY